MLSPDRIINDHPFTEFFPWDQNRYRDERRHLTEEHVNNLLRLATYLLVGKTHMKFYMGTIMWRIAGAESLEPRDWVCGTVGCALGHGPAAGIPTIGREGWDDYCERSFGVEVCGMAWTWLFSGSWENNPQAAGTRIIRLLREGCRDERHELYPNGNHQDDALVARAKEYVG